MIGIIQDIGWADRHGMNGVLPISWLEIKAYAELTLGVTEPWEFKALRKMSESYVHGLKHGENPLAIFPGEGEEYEGEEDTYEWVMI